MKYHSYFLFVFSVCIESFYLICLQIKSYETKKKYLFLRYKIRSTSIRSVLESRKGIEYSCKEILQIEQII